MDFILTSYTPPKDVILAHVQSLTSESKQPTGFLILSVFSYSLISLQASSVNSDPLFEKPLLAYAKEKQALQP